ncbi:DDE-type integrase/transposase/recombinase [Sedimentitalea sp.]|uniref:DDE-type integrase/transposase/recombinase n=1 Tax=Sedimentitalea sp. TaxID=2048915 RepID=UPI003297EA77
MTCLADELGPPSVVVTDKLRPYGVAKREIMPSVEHRFHKGLNNRPENSHQLTRRQERGRKKFKSPGHLQRLLSLHDPIANLSHLPLHEVRSLALQTWREISQVETA